MKVLALQPVSTPPGFAGRLVSKSATCSVVRSSALERMPEENVLIETLL
jgi:hypothetical protein